MTKKTLKQENEKLALENYKLRAELVAAKRLIDVQRQRINHDQERRAVKYMSKSVFTERKQNK